MDKVYEALPKPIQILVSLPNIIAKVLYTSIKLPMEMSIHGFSIRTWKGHYGWLDYHNFNLIKLVLILPLIPI